MLIRHLTELLWNGLYFCSVRQILYLRPGSILATLLSIFLTHVVDPWTSLIHFWYVLKVSVIKAFNIVKS